MKQIHCSIRCRFCSGLWLDSFTLHEEMERLTQEMDDNRTQSFNAIIFNFFFYFFAVKTCRSYFNFQSINGTKEEIGGLKKKVIKI